MSDENRDYVASVGSGLDYKTLFLGSCTLLVLLGGGAFGIWNSGSERNNDRLQQTIDRLHQSIDKVSERLAEVEARERESRYRIEYLERFTERK